MPEKENKREYEFEFKCADFEIEFKGDLNFVLNQLRKYEPKILLKLNQLVSGEKLSEISKISPRPSEQTAPVSSGGQSFHQERAGIYRRKRQIDRRAQGQYEKEKNPARAPDFVESQEFEEMGSRQIAERKKLELSAEELRSLLERYQPRTSHDRVMIFAFYLEERIESFSSSEIQECYQVVGERSPTNLSVILNNAVRSGFLLKEEKGGKARYRLSLKGKRYVENGLRLD